VENAARRGRLHGIALRFIGVTENGASAPSTKKRKRAITLVNACFAFHPRGGSGNALVGRRNPLCASRRACGLFALMWMPAVATQ
jgi:hypothetical protein